MNMPCGNTAALREYEAQQERLERQAPNEYELENFIDHWMERKAQKLGIDFIYESFTESDEEDLIELFQAYQSVLSIEIGSAMKKIINDYWRPAAEAAAAGHNFDEDRI